MDSGCKFRGTAGIEYWKPQSGEAFERRSIWVWGLGSLTVDSQRSLFQRSTGHLLQHFSLALNIYFTIQEERQEDFLLCHYDSSLLLTNSSKIIYRSNIKGKTFSLKFFSWLLLHCCVLGMCVKIEEKGMLMCFIWSFIWGLLAIFKLNLNKRPQEFKPD